MKKSKTNTVTTQTSKLSNRFVKQFDRELNKNETLISNYEAWCI